MKGVFIINVLYDLMGGMIAGLILGYQIDKWFVSSPWGLIICSSLGICGGLYNCIKNLFKS
jgi:ATP synthase protein I